MNTTGSPRRVHHISHLMKSLSNQTFQDFEILIATEKTSKELRKAVSSLLPPEKFEIEEFGHWNKCKTANEAIKSTDGDVVVLLEDDLVLERKWLESVLESFDRHPEAGAVCSKCIWKHKEGLASQAGVKARIANLWDHMSVSKSVFARKRERIKDHLVSVPTFTMCVACRREALLDAGLFDESVEEPIQGEDYDLAMRIRSTGYRILLNENARAIHYTRQVSKKTSKVREDPKFIEGNYLTETYFYAKNFDEIGLNIIPHAIHRVAESVNWAARSRKPSAIYHGGKGTILGLIKGLRKFF